MRRCRASHCFVNFSPNPPVASSRIVPCSSPRRVPLGTDSEVRRFEPFCYEPRSRRLVNQPTGKVNATEISGQIGKAEPRPAILGIQNLLGDTCPFSGLRAEDRREPRRHEEMLGQITPTVQRQHTEDGQTSGAFPALVSTARQVRPTIGIEAPMSLASSSATAQPEHEGRHALVFREARHRADSGLDVETGEVIALDRFGATGIFLASAHHGGDDGAGSLDELLAQGLAGLGVSAMGRSRRR